MYVINSFFIDITQAPVAITNDANVNTGNQSELWSGTTPNTTTGATGNPAAGVGAINVTAPAIYTGQQLAVKLDLKISTTLLAGQSNLIKVPLSKVGVHKKRGAKSATILGVYNENSAEDIVAATASFIGARDTNLAAFSIVKNALIINISNGAQALYEGKTIQILVGLN